MGSNLGKITSQRSDQFQRQVSQLSLSSSTDGHKPPDAMRGYSLPDYAEVSHWATTSNLISEKIMRSFRKPPIFFPLSYLLSEQGNHCFGKPNLVWFVGSPRNPRTVGNHIFHPRLSFVACRFRSLFK